MLRNLIITFSLLTAACASSGGRYQPPQPSAAPEFTVSSSVLSTARGDGAGWWDRFEDPALTELVSAALSSNLDIREAVTRVEASRAIRSEARRELLPGGGISAAQTHESLGRERSRLASVGASVGWEIDLFGRVRNVNRAAMAELEATEASLEQIRLLVASEVARTWFLLQRSQARLGMLQRYHDDQAELVRIIAARVEEGVDDDADLSRAEALLAEDAAALISERHAANTLRHSLAVLTAADPVSWHPPSTSSQRPLNLQPIAIGSPAELLQRRADVREAERLLAAETADIGIASSALFPQLHIGGVFGFLAGSIGDLGDSSGESWSIGPSISWGIFDLGRVRARIRAERAGAEGALASYERTVLRALEDAQNAFSAYTAAQESLAVTEEGLRSARRGTELVEIRYEEGLSAYFELLDARRSAVRAEMARIDSIAEHRIATIDVLRALGSDPGLDLPTEGRITIAAR